MATYTVTSIPRRSLVVCFRDADYNSLLDNWYNPKCADPDNEKHHITEMAASFKRKDIRLEVYYCDKVSFLIPKEENNIV